MTAEPTSPSASPKRAGTLLILAALILASIVVAWVATPRIATWWNDRTVAVAADSVAGGEVESLTLENLVVNPAGSDGMRYLILSMVIEPSSSADAETLRKRDAQVRDLATGVAGLYRTEWLAGTPQRDSLKVFLGDTLAAALKLDRSPTIYFPQYVLQ